MGGFFVVSGGHSPIFFQPANKTFNNVALFVSFAVNFRPKLMALSERNYWLKSGIRNLLA
jgi:hypothetical protein